MKAWIESQSSHKKDIKPVQHIEVYRYDSECKSNC